MLVLQRSSVNLLTPIKLNQDQMHHFYYHQTRLAPRGLDESPTKLSENFFQLYS